VRTATATEGVAAAPGRRADRVYEVTFWLCAGLAVYLVWHHRYLPMVDLPQHATQLSAWVHLYDPAFGFARQFELNFSTPYLAAYLLARPLAGLGVVTALKVVITLAVLGLPLALRVLLRQHGRDHYWALLGFPLAFSFAFYFGFVVFLFAAPLYLLAIVAAFSYSNRPTPLRGVALMALTTAVFFAHGMAFYLTLATCGLISLLTPGTARGRLTLIAPLLVPIFVATSWTVQFLAIGAYPGDEFVHWALGLSRFSDLLGNQLGLGWDDPVATLAGVVMLLLPWLEGIRWARDPRRYVPLAVTLLFCLGTPASLQGLPLIHPRFSTFLMPGVLLALEAPPVPTRRLHRPAVAVVAVAWLALLLLRFQGFQGEASGFDRILAQMEPNKRVRPLIFARGSVFIPKFAVFVHFPAYYQAEKGGYLGFSFARNWTAVVRYRAGVDVGMATGAEWEPELFSYAREGAGYDYFVVRSGPDLRHTLFGAAAARVSLVAREGSWWLFRNPPSPGGGP
jgi:hypothetical protein